MSNKTAKLADSSPLPLDGVVTLELKIGPTCGISKLLVADISNDGILGLDNLCRMGAKLDFTTFELSTKWGSIKCERECDEILFCRISTSETVTVPAGHEVLIKGTVNDKLKPNRFGIVEVGESQNHLIKSGLIVARTLVRTGNDNIPMRIFNPSTSNKVIRKGTCLGTITVVDKGDIHTPSNSERKDCDEIPDHLRDLLERSTEELPEQFHQDVAKLLIEFQDVFSKGDNDIGRTNDVEHSIDTGSQHPIRQRPRKHPLGQRTEIKRQVSELLDKGLIEPTDSPWASNIVLVRKKDGTQRFCVDYRQLNVATIKDAYPLPRIDETLDALSGASWFSTLDLASGYWQVGLDHDAKQKSAFLADGGLYAWNVMPFGLCNAPATFERLMDKVLRGLHWETLLVYLDDVIVFGSSVPEELARLKQVFQRLRQANLKLKPKKCHLFKTKVSYLGHEVSNLGVSTQTEKTEAIENWPTPTNVKEVRSFLGLASYYRRFVKDFATIAKPLHQLTEKKRAGRFEWSPVCQSAFDELKHRLTSTPILAYPSLEGELILDTDASKDGIGGVLSQVHDGHERVIAYGSKVLNKAEQNYCVTRRELLAVVTYLKHFKQYLYGRHVKVRTDHGALRWLTNFKQPEGQLARWLEVVSEYDIEIVHRAGRSHANADALSRRPCTQCGRENESELETDETNFGRTCVIQLSEDGNDVEIRKAQLDDPSLRSVIEALERGTKPTKEEMSPLSFRTKVLLGHWGQLHLCNGVLYRKWESEDSRITRDRLVLPKQKVHEVLEELHSGTFGGHLGSTKTLKNVQYRYYWVGMKEDVRSFIRQCTACCKRKTHGKKRKAPLQQRRSGSPMERIALDILGPLPLTYDGNRYILVVADYYTKFVEAYAIPDEQAQTVAQKLVEEFVCRYGVPKEIHSDQGRNFESNLFKEVCKLIGAKKTRTTPNNPKSDGMVERFNRTLLSILVTMIDPVERQQDWDRYIPFATAAYRSTVHETTQETPNMMMFGREVNHPLDLTLNQSTPELSTDYAAELRNRMEDIHTRVTLQTDKNLRRQKKNYDRHTIHEKFSKGQFVWLRNDFRRKGVSPKLTNRWEGPFKVITRLSDVTYRIQLTPRSKPKIVHFDRLKPFEGPNPASWPELDDTNLPDLPAEDSSNHSGDEDEDGSVDAGQAEVPPLDEELSRRYPSRSRRPPDYFY